MISHFPKNPWGTFHVENKFTKTNKIFFWTISQKSIVFSFKFFSKKIMGFSLHIFQKPMEFFHEKQFSKNSWDFSRKNPFPRIYLIRKHLQKSMVFLSFWNEITFQILWTFHLFEINFLLQNKLLFLKITMEFSLFKNGLSKIIYPSKYIQRNNFNKPKILFSQNAKKKNKIFSSKNPFRNIFPIKPKKHKLKIFLLGNLNFGW